MLEPIHLEAWRLFILQLIWTDDQEDHHVVVAKVTLQCIKLHTTQSIINKLLISSVSFVGPQDCPD